jgi:hypothetical protein
MSEQRKKNSRGFILPFIIIAILILSVLATGLIMAGFGVRMQAINTKSQTVALLAAEAGYEQAIFWMSQQSDILSSLQDAHSGATGTIDLGPSSCEYQVDFDDFIGARPVFRVTSTGTSGINSRVVDVQVVQEITGWVMGKCRIPNGTNSTTQVYFVNGEILDIPIHINNLKDSPDERDIYISGSPTFIQKVEMGEPRKINGTGSDKYGSVMELFEDGIYFDQPNVRITDSVAVQSKVNRFRDSTNSLFRFTPAGTANLGNGVTGRNAVQLEFYVEGGIGKVRINNHCTVRTCTPGANDYNIVSNSNPAAPMTFQKYNIYAYHYAPDTLYVPSLVYPVTDTYVTQQFGGKQSAPGGQIYVNGDVIIGGAGTVPDPNMVVKGKMTVVATGNIWIADAITVDGTRDANGMPLEGNPNCLGLIAKGVVKVIDPGMSNSPSILPAPDVNDRLIPSHKHFYKPVAIADGSPANTNVRKLPKNMIVEAAVTVGGGGWGAENVPNRKVTTSGKNDYLILHGTISECVRGIVGQGTAGYIKKYYLDTRLMEGILPGDIWFGGKYVPAPAGWHDYRQEE